MGRDIDKFSYLSIKEISEITGINYRTLRRYCEKNKYSYRKVFSRGKGGKKYEILISSLEPELQNKIFFNYKQGAENKDQLPAPFSLNLPISSNVYGNTPFYYSGTAVSETGGSSIALKKPVPESAKNMALAKFNAVDFWLKYRNEHKNKDTADKEFLLGYNNKIIYKQTSEITGKISKSSLYRWKKTLEENNNDYHSLINGYNYVSEFQLNTSLTDEEKQEFISLYYNDSKMNLKTVYNLLKFKKNQQGTEIKSYAAYKRFADFITRNHYDFEVLSREGEKAYNDKAGFYLHRDTSDLKVGDCFVADGNKLDFMVINPFTGKPARATLLVYLDWVSFDIAGYEIMMSENTQCIASALRNSILRLGKIPKRVYLDNGKAFKGQFFTGIKDFSECKFNGVYKNLGIKITFAHAYSGRSKVVERFFRNFVQSCPPLVSSYIGNCIDNRPAHLRRNEKLHKKLHENDKTPTIEQAKLIIDKWLEYYRQQPCPHDKSKTIQDVFNNGVGSGVNIEMLDELMMSAQIRTIKRNIIRLFGLEYSSEVLYGLNTEAIVKYSIFDLSKIKVYSLKGKYIGEVPLVTYVKAFADDGSLLDQYNYKMELKRQKDCKKLSVKKTKAIMGKVTPYDELLETKKEKVLKIEDKQDKKEQKKEKYDFTANYANVHNFQTKKLDYYEDFYKKTYTK